MPYNNRYKKQDVEDLVKEQVYKTKNGIVFIVEPIFDENANDTIATSLFKIMQNEIEISL